MRSHSVEVPTFGIKLSQHLDKVLDLWDQLHGLGVYEADAGAMLCMERICTWLDAQDASWLGIAHVLKGPGQARADKLFGWRIRAILPLNLRYRDSPQKEPAVKQTRTDEHPGAANMALMKGVGLFRAYTLQSGELVDVSTFQQTDHYELYYRKQGVCDRIWVAFPVNADAESVFCFDRIGHARHFGKDDLQLAAFSLRGIKWFHHQLLLNHGLGLCLDPLTAPERRVIQGLLAGATERTIASKLNLSQGTVHQYATRVYRKFGVRGRSEFAALWLCGSF